jgi:hypothetical protein
MMAVTDDLRAIAEGAHGELNAVHDFFEHSKTVWQSFQLLVNQGHSGFYRNTATGTTIDQQGLLDRAPRYTRAYLATFTFRQFVVAAESFLFSLLHRLLLHNPWQFARSQLEFEVVLKASDRAEIISTLIGKQLNELKYGNLRDWFVALNKAVALDCPSEDETAALAEVKATRDILEHNAGIVNEIYLRKAGKKARHTPGDQIEIDDTYHLESWRLIRKVVSDVTAAAVARLTKP